MNSTGINADFLCRGIIGESEALRRILRDVETVAPTDSTVLIYGETGTGKERVAQALHDLSPRKASAFVRLNCAAVPATLFESELFGHERGAFTGAISQRAGRFELSNHGTIFLDEIGEIPLELQPKLLRALQEREFERLGGIRTVRFDARVIAATNCDLKAMVEQRAFRSDLYYRLNVFPIRVPPLRERVDDIPLLVWHFVERFSTHNNRDIRAIPAETMDALKSYHWPGNIRELQNVIERSVIISTGPSLTAPLDELLPDSGPRILPASKNLRQELTETERSKILRVLEESNGVIAGRSGAAARLGIKRTTLHSRMQRLGIRVLRTPGSEASSPSSPGADRRVLDWPGSKAGHRDGEAGRPAFA